VYSVHDSADARSRLVTAFPITRASYQSYTQPSSLGDAMSIVTRYNAYVEGVSGKTWTGSRTFAPAPIR
jgi:hypothetical protein